MQMDKLYLFLSDSSVLSAHLLKIIKNTSILVISIADPFRAVKIPKTADFQAYADQAIV